MIPHRKNCKKKSSSQSKASDQPYFITLSIKSSCLESRLT